MAAGEPSLGPSAIVPVGEASGTHAPASLPSIDGARWWTRYRASLDGRLSQTALSILEADATYIIDRAVAKRAELRRAKTDEPEPILIRKKAVTSTALPK